MKLLVGLILILVLAASVGTVALGWYVRGDPGQLSRLAVWSDRTQACRVLKRLSSSNQIHLTIAGKGACMITNLKTKVKQLIRSRQNQAALRDLSASERDLVTRILEQRLTYLSHRKMVSLLRTSREIEENQIPGLFVEAGCALGGSAILIALTKKVTRPLNIYDVFGMIPGPTDDDTADVHQRYRIIVEGGSEGLGGDEYYGYQADLYETVRSNMTSFGIDLEDGHVSLIKGLVQDTMQIDQPIAFAHVDVDWYEPVMTCLERIYPRLSVGGSIILDDYHDWGGCRKATDEYLETVSGPFALNDSSGSMKITKLSGG